MLRWTVVALLFITAAPTVLSGNAVAEVVVAQQTSAAAPLASSFTTASGAKAIVAMGRKGDPTNTFWELATQKPGTLQWAIITPPGVADNGGLVVAPGVGERLIAGFEPSQFLHFSPLASLARVGAKWTAAILPQSLVSVPDALAPTSTGIYALSRFGPSVVMSNALAKSWHIVVTKQHLSAGADASQCAPSQLTAITSGANKIFLGVKCLLPGHVGVFTQTSSHWVFSGPKVPRHFKDAPIKTLRLTAAVSGIDGLFAGTTRAGTSLFASRRAVSGSSWVTSPRLALHRGEKITSSGTTANGGEFVVLTHLATTRIVTVGPAMRIWQTLPTPPPGVTNIATGVTGLLFALDPIGNHLLVYGLSGKTWQLRQTVTIAIAYGSSG